jgi:predicted transcriptional regulator
MAMNLRLRDELTEELRSQAEAEGVSMHAIVTRALEDYLARNAKQAMVRQAAMDQAAKWRELMERLK